jgi:hypothetical protein
MIYAAPSPEADHIDFQNHGVYRNGRVWMERCDESNLLVGRPKSHLQDDVIA